MSQHLLYSYLCIQRNSAIFLEQQHTAFSGTLSLLYTITLPRHTCSQVLQGSQEKLLILVYEAVPKNNDAIFNTNEKFPTIIYRRKKEKQFVVLGSVIQALLQSVI